MWNTILVVALNGLIMAGCASALIICMRAIKSVKETAPSGVNISNFFDDEDRIR